MTINMSCTAEKEKERGWRGRENKKERFMLRNLLSEYGGKLTGWEFKEGMTLVIE